MSPAETVGSAKNVGLCDDRYGSSPQNDEKMTLGPKKFSSQVSADGAGECDQALDLAPLLGQDSSERVSRVHSTTSNPSDHHSPSFASSFLRILR